MSAGLCEGYVFSQRILFIFGKGLHPSRSIAKHVPHPMPGAGEASLERKELQAVGWMTSPFPTLGSHGWQRPRPPRFPWRAGFEGKDPHPS